MSQHDDEDRRSRPQSGEGVSSAERPCGDAQPRRGASCQRSAIPDRHVSGEQAARLSSPRPRVAHMPRRSSVLLGIRRVSLSLVCVSLLTASPRIDVGAQASSQDGAPAAQSLSDIAGLLLAQHQVVTFPALKKKVKRTIEKRAASTTLRQPGSAFSEAPPRC